MITEDVNHLKSTYFSGLHHYYRHADLIGYIPNASKTLTDNVYSDSMEFVSHRSNHPALFFLL